MRRRMKGGAATARGTSKAVTRIAAAASVPALVVGQSLSRWRRQPPARRHQRGAAAADARAGRAAVEEREPARHRDHEEPARGRRTWAASAATARAAAVASAQAPLMSELRAGARHPRQELHAGQRVRRHGVQGRGGAAQGEPVGRGGHPGRDDPRCGSPRRRRPRPVEQRRRPRPTTTHADAQHDPRRLRPERPGRSSTPRACR